LIDKKIDTDVWFNQSLMTSSTCRIRKIGFCLFLGALHTCVLAGMTVPAGASFNVGPGATLDLSCSDFTVLGNASVGTGQIKASNLQIGSGGVLDGGQGTVQVSGSWSNAGQFNAGTGTVLITDQCATGPVTITGATTFNNLTLRATTNNGFQLPAGQHITVTGTLTLQSSTGGPLQLGSNGLPAYIDLAPGATVVGVGNYVSASVQVGAAGAALASGVPALGWRALMGLSLLLAAAVLFLRGFGPAPARPRPRCS
jgi:hypothetical protein